MRDEPMQDDSSHYEISLTAGQAFTAFVLLLLSLAASFAFGVIIGRGGSPQPPPTTPEAKITENATGSSNRAPAVDLPVSESAGATKTVKEPRAFAAEPKPSRAAKPKPPAAVPHIAEGSAKPTPAKAAPATSAPVPYFAQILSTREGPAAEALAAKLINDGFKTAYVERIPSDGGMIYRVRVRFPSESAARAAVSRLRGYAPGEIWVTHE